MFLLDALARSGHASRFHLLVVGELEPEVHAQLLALPPELAWSHVGFVDRYELLPWYAACDLVAIPSLYDGMPNVLLEAGALGVPVLGSTAGGLADVLDDETLRFRPGDVHEACRALDAAAMLPDPALRALGDRLRARVVGGFDHRTEAARYRQILLETAGARVSLAPPALATTGDLR